MVGGKFTANLNEVVEKLSGFLKAFPRMLIKPDTRNEGKDLYELYSYFPAAFISKIEDHKDVKGHQGSQYSHKTIYIVVHDQMEDSRRVSDERTIALDTDIVGVYSSKYAANTRVLSFTEAKIKQEDYLDEIESLEKFSRLWWRVNEDGLARVSFRSNLDQDHDVYAHAMEVDTSGLAGEADVAFPARRWWNYV
ncbi:hypothetical protein F5X99DRAFT_427289 [Biscogniauxia marginata]|nr:hypothetical protein F5X99DRAFT_427289 [Biscogniauxia marginata]